MTEQRTLVLVKPDGVKGQHIGDIITRIEHKGYQIAALKVIQATKEQLEAHYKDKINAPFFPELVSYMQEGPLVGVIVTGTNVVSVIHGWQGQLTQVKLIGEQYGGTLGVSGRMGTCAM